MTPEDRKYNQSHEWIKADGDEWVIGITDHAQKELGDITFVELPEIGSAKTAGQEAGVIESVKAASDIYAPVRGEISAVNEALEEAPEQVNEDPYGNGWIFKMKNVSDADLAKLLSAADYEAGLG